MPLLFEKALTQKIGNIWEQTYPELKKSGKPVITGFPTKL